MYTFLSGSTMQHLGEGVVTWQDPMWAQQVCRGHAERQPGPAWRGQLSDGPDAEEVLEDQAGLHQSHRQEGGRVRGGL